MYYGVLTFIGALTYELTDLYHGPCGAGGTDTHKYQLVRRSEASEEIACTSNSQCNNGECFEEVTALNDTMWYCVCDDGYQSLNQDGKRIY